MRAYELTETPQYFYHGTSKEEAAKAILNSGKIIPGDHSGKSENNLTPIVNRAYITSDLGYALIYALGGNYIGTKAAAKLSGYGYIFKIHKSSIKNRIPDEDKVGEITRDIISGDDTHGFQPNEIAELKSLVSYAFDFDIIQPDYDEDARDLIIPAYDRFLDHEYEFFAAVGKYILSKGSKRLIASFRRISPHHSGEGEMIIDGAWRFKKSDAAKMKKDGSNFFDYAIKIF